MKSRANDSFFGFDARFLNWLINVARLARREIERRDGFAVEQHELATKDSKERIYGCGVCMFASTSDSTSGWETNENLKGALAQTSCFQQYPNEDKWHRMVKTLPKVKCKSRSFLQA